MEVAILEPENSSILESHLGKPLFTTVIFLSCNRMSVSGRFPTRNPSRDLCSTWRSLKGPHDLEALTLPQNAIIFFLSEENIFMQLFVQSAQSGWFLAVCLPMTEHKAVQCISAQHTHLIQSLVIIRCSGITVLENGICLA